MELINITNEGAELLAGAVFSKDIVGKFLGPTADYIGSGIKGFAEKRVGNARAILARAIEMTKNIDEQGSVPPKVMRDVLSDGSMSDDPLSVEYYGGVLASSRTGVIRDDRAAVVTAALGRLSTYQIRGHYIFYHCIRQAHIGSLSNIYDGRGRGELATFIPFETVISALDLVGDEIPQFDEIQTHIMFGLSRENLIEPNFWSGQPNDLAGQVTGELGIGGFLVSPSVLGAEMFVRAYGAALSPNTFLRPDLAFPVRPEVAIAAGSRKPRD